MYTTYIVAVAWTAGIGGITLATVPSVIAWARRKRRMRTAL